MDLTKAENATSRIRRNQMAAYVIVDITGMKDPDGLQQYREQVLPLVEEYGGQYLAVTDTIQAFEGSWTPGFMAILEFESLKRAQEFYDCPAYQPLKSLRQQSIDANIITVDGAIAPS
jgi:uncharacterized protein (DUF1330 family)